MLKTLVRAADQASSAGFWAHFNIVYLLTYNISGSENSGSGAYLLLTLLLRIVTMDVRPGPPYILLG